MVMIIGVNPGGCGSRHSDFGMRGRGRVMKYSLPCTGSKFAGGDFPREFAQNVNGNFVWINKNLAVND